MDSLVRGVAAADCVKGRRLIATGGVAAACFRKGVSTNCPLCDVQATLNRLNRRPDNRWQR